MLATEETKTVYRDNRGTSYANRDAAEASTVLNLTGAPIAVDQMNVFLRKLTTHGDLREWLLQQLGVQPAVATLPSLEQLLEITMSIREMKLYAEEKAQYIHEKLKEQGLKQPEAYPVPTAEQLQGIVISLDAAHCPLNSDKAKYLHQLLSALPNAEKVDNKEPDGLTEKLVKYYNAMDWSSVGEKQMFMQIGYQLERDGYQLIKK